MRGTPHVIVDLHNPVRIIPAHAGNTSVDLARSLHVGDHPRACGEHPKEHIGADVQEGSSPRMRGTRAETVEPAEGGGIIPAHAGNTPLRFTRSRPRRDHPRACGEHHIRAEHAPCGLGSSPRMRGTPVGLGRFGRVGGIIPAHAGNTAALNVEALAAAGSSPRMRGTRGEQCRQCLFRGIIPAHAGNTRLPPAE